MPTFVNIGMTNVSTPQQNSMGVFIGELNMTGWDANMKMNLGEGGTFGVFCFVTAIVNYTFDGFEVADGNILDQDFKPQIGANI